MSLFENISFINEGEQADAYKARKQKEKEEKRKAERERFDRRYKVDGNRAEYTGSKLHPDKKPNSDEEYDAMSTKDQDTYETDNKRHVDAKEFRKDESMRRDDNATRMTGLISHDVDRAYKHYDPLSRMMIAHRKTVDYADRLEKRDKMGATDAINRDMRRHPDRWKRDSEGKPHRESGIFESVQFINE